MSYYRTLRDRADVLGAVPRVHGNGFIQLDLNKAGTRRLHIWDDEIPRQEVATPIHDHVFDMVSEVVHGTLIHETFTTRSDAFHGTHKIYRAERAEGTQNTTLKRVPGIVSLVTREKLILGAGSIYHFDHGQLHESTHIGTTVTLMEKHNPPEGYGSPRVLVPVGAEPDNDFHRDAFDPEMLWAIIRNALEPEREPRGCRAAPPGAPNRVGMML